MTEHNTEHLVKKWKTYFPPQVFHLTRQQIMLGFSVKILHSPTFWLIKHTAFAATTKITLSFQQDCSLPRHLQSKGIESIIKNNEEFRSCFQGILPSCNTHSTEARLLVWRQHHYFMNHQRPLEDTRKSRHVHSLPLIF